MFPCLGSIFFILPVFNDKVQVHCAKSEAKLQLFTALCYKLFTFEKLKKLRHVQQLESLVCLLIFFSADSQGWTANQKLAHSACSVGAFMGPVCLTMWHSIHKTIDWTHFTVATVSELSNRWVCYLWLEVTSCFSLSMHLHNSFHFFSQRLNGTTWCLNCPNGFSFIFLITALLSCMCHSCTMYLPCRKSTDTPHPITEKYTWYVSIILRLCVGGWT